MRSAPGLLAQAITQGVVACADVLDGAVSLVPVPRSNLVHRLEVGGSPVAYVKQQGHATATDGFDTVGREALVLAGLRGAPVPTVLHADDDAVWTSVVPGTSLECCLPAAPRPVAAALGTALARLHRHPLTAGVPRATRPWPITGVPPAGVRTAPPASLPAQLAARVGSSARGTEGAALRRAGQRWRHTCWIHGDLSVANVLVVVSGTGARARFVDLEDGGVGDPSWDLVGALRLLDDTLVLGELEGARRALLGAYAAGLGPGRPDVALRLAHDVVTDTRAALSDLVAAGRVRQEWAS